MDRGAVTGATHAHSCERQSVLASPTCCCWAYRPNAGPHCMNSLLHCPEQYLNVVHKHEADVNGSSAVDSPGTAHRDLEEQGFAHHLHALRP